MRQVVIAGADLRVSRFIFGTASLLSVGLSGARRRILEQAVEAGFTHFDTAPSYGLGVSERDLGAVLARHPKITVTTKAGLYSPGGEDQPAAFVAARKAAGRLYRPLSRDRADGTVARARRSLDASLRRLGRERVDLLMIHEPDIGLIATDEWRRWLEDEKDRVGAYGLAGEWRRLSPFIARGDPLAKILQAPFEQEAQDRRPQIAYGVSRAAEQAGQPVSDETFVEALKRDPEGAVIVASARPERIARFAALSERA
jgi:aryl-alcohol dehydrogenase-like predicted oxidoreductase